MTTIGIIGYGKFGELMKKVFSEFIPDVQIKISSRSNPVDNKTFFNLEEVCTCDFIIPSVPIKFFEETILKIKDLVKEGSTIVDVCSIKIHPKEVMLKNLPENVNIICTHPNFGPESYRLNDYSTKGLNFIIENVRCNKEVYAEIMKFLKLIEVNIIEISVEKHDKEIGIPHFTSMFIGLLLTRMDMKRTELGAASTQRMFDMLEGVGKDFGILEDMYRYNPFCKDYLERMGVEFSKLHKEMG